MGFRHFVFTGIASVAVGSTVELPHGLRLSGLRATSALATSSDVDQYLGIPFATPPVGSLRFAPPEPFTGRWPGVRRFEKIAKGCFSGKTGTTEDCLYLNVYRPSGIAAGEELPVMVWIYGGGFTSGSTTLYNGTELAARNRVIIVVPAYRLGMLGFYKGNWGILDQQLALRWVRDNISAFRGDKSRVALFGQSAGAFSVAAHLVSPGSRGLFSAAILSSPTAHSSFFFQDEADANRFSDWAAKSLADCDDIECLRSVPVSRLLVENGHRDAKMPDWASRLFPYMPWGITIDHKLISDTPLRLAQAGHVADVPVIIGITQEEGSAFSLMLNVLIRPAFRGDIPASMIRNITHHLLGDDELVNRAMRDYPLHEQFVGPPAPVAEPANKTSNMDELIAQFRAIVDRDFGAMSEAEFNAAVPVLNLTSLIPAAITYDRAPASFFKQTMRNSLFACPLIEFSDAIAKHNGGRVWAYNFALDVWADTPWSEATLNAMGIPGNTSLAEMGAFHGAELPFIWNLFPKRPVTPNELTNPMTAFNAFIGQNFCPANSFKRSVANQIGCLWTNLAKCGSPHCSASSCNTTTEWAAYGSGQYLNIEGRGELRMRSVVPTGREAIDAPMPSIQQCELWKDVRLPFHNFVGVAAPALLEASARSGSAHASILAVAFALLVILM